MSEPHDGFIRHYLQLAPEEKPPLDPEDIRLAYLSGESVDSLRRRYRVGHAKIMRELRRTGVILRDHLEATTLAQQKRRGARNEPRPWISRDWRPPSP